LSRYPTHDPNRRMHMKTINNISLNTLAARAAAFALALVTTSALATGTAIVFTAEPAAAGASSLVAALAPLRALLG
jgi:hypothetical protein